MSPSSLIAKGVKGYLVFLFFIESTKFAGLNEVAQFLTTMIGYVPDLIIAIFIIIVGIRIGGTIELESQLNGGCVFSFTWPKTMAIRMTQA